jgi:hypothetical protein
VPLHNRGDQSRAEGGDVTEEQKHNMQWDQLTPSPLTRTSRRQLTTKQFVKHEQKMAEYQSTIQQSLPRSHLQYVRRHACMAIQSIYKRGFLRTVFRPSDIRRHSRSLSSDLKEITEGLGLSSRGGGGGSSDPRHWLRCRLSSQGVNNVPQKSATRVNFQPEYEDSRALWNVTCETNTLSQCRTPISKNPLYEDSSDR